VWVAGCLFDFLRPFFWPQETLRPLWGQAVAVEVQVHQREGRAQPLVVLPDAPVAHPGKSEDPLEDAGRMLDLGSHAGLGRVLALDFFIHIVLVSGPARSPVLRFGRSGANRIGRALISGVAPHAALIAVQ